MLNAVEFVLDMTTCGAKTVAEFLDSRYSKTLDEEATKQMVYLLSDCDQLYGKEGRAEVDFVPHKDDSPHKWHKTLSLTGVPIVAEYSIGYGDASPQGIIAAISFTDSEVELDIEQMFTLTLDNERIPTEYHQRIVDLTKIYFDEMKGTMTWGTGPISIYWYFEIEDVVESMLQDEGHDVLWLKNLINEANENTENRYVDHNESIFEEVMRRITQKSK